MDSSNKGHLRLSGQHDMHGLNFAIQINLPTKDTFLSLKGITECTYVSQSAPMCPLLSGFTSHVCCIHTPFDADCSDFLFFDWTCSLSPLSILRDESGWLFRFLFVLCELTQSVYEVKMGKKSDIGSSTECSAGKVSVALEFYLNERYKT